VIGSGAFNGYGTVSGGAGGAASAVGVVVSGGAVGGAATLLLLQFPQPLLLLSFLLAPLGPTVLEPHLEK